MNVHRLFKQLSGFVFLFSSYMYFQIKIVLGSQRGTVGQGLLPRLIDGLDLVYLETNLLLGDNHTYHLKNFCVMVVVLPVVL